jgi:hypothetical protein
MEGVTRGSLRLERQMSNPNTLFEHFADPTFRDQQAVGPGRGRLSFTYGKGDGNWETVARIIQQCATTARRWYPDANVAFLPATEVIWEAMRAAGLGTPGGVGALTSVTLAEMDEWLNAPFRLKDRAGNINEAIASNTWLHAVKKPGFPFGLGIRGYMLLLGERRRLASVLPNGSTYVGTPAADKCTTMNAIGVRMGRRAQGLAKKGRADAENNGMINVSDELHCLIVITRALVGCQESMILTADEDYIEVFFKAAWLIDTHYRAWLAAKMVKDGFYGAPVKVVKDTFGFFKNGATLYRRPTENFREVLPSLYEPVRVGVVHVTPHGRIQYVTFTFERLMLEMVQTRGATNGRCTDLFGAANIHVDVSPLHAGLGYPCLGIGEDEGISLESQGHTMFLSLLDLLHCVHCKERFTK